MGIDIGTYRCRIGTFQHGPGIDVVLLEVNVNYTGGMKVVGAVSFIGLLLLMAGIEANPGPSADDLVEPDDKYPVCELCLSGKQSFVNKRGTVSNKKKFKNRQNMTFDDVEMAADQEFEMHPDPSGVLEYSTKVTRFNQCECISIHFPSNYGAETSKVYYIGLKGDFQQAHRHEVTICTYETTPNMADHKTNLFDSVNHEIQ